MSLYYQISYDDDFSDDDNTQDNNNNIERPVRPKKHMTKAKKESPRHSRDGNPYRKLMPMPKEKYKKNAWLNSEEE